MSVEMLDIYDSHGKITGEIRPRGAELSEGESILVVFAWIFNSEGKVLMTKRHPAKGLFPSLWDIPGGCVTAGESSLEGVLRETLEEVGVRLDEGEASLAKTRMEPNRIFEDWVFYRDIKLHELFLQPDEVSEAEWMSLEGIMTLDEDGLTIPGLLWLYSEIFSRFSSRRHKGRLHLR